MYATTQQVVVGAGACLAVQTQNLRVYIHTNARVIKTVITFRCGLIRI